mmetsp:Transcript_10796/g.17674  ORF Transcript_10796/g.17674 Transcript_10796/m.17674 type:complete len:594 (-) Transcript_10796:416-2197(-)|eukprot:CAMPEP_0184644690 /NCGR_PEP_ID=MMETSP0308-20130426/1373_1 /TAXON_ID=38269 /ORGANISM="Gloeochaete witrockiana, Strain SAG 46.84" /LENGTH=593 /DNA_ID=CAMNT_0027073371 /DNA_START=85 /DNA_END=1866 /DNA_ORIENTATION=+
MLRSYRLISLSRNLYRASIHYYSTSAAISPALSPEDLQLLATPRDEQNYDVAIVGAGPAGLSAAIRLKQLSLRNNKEISVCVLEKASEVGAHILSGNVFEPRALDELLPEWRSEKTPIVTPAVRDEFKFLTKKYALPLPNPPSMNNHGNFVISLSQLVRWLGSRAEELGVDIFPGFAASEVLYDERGAVTGVATNDVGIGKNGKPKETFQRGMELKARLTLFAEGCRGSLSKQLESKFNLREGAQHQTYGLGFKEVWRIDPSKHQAGYIMHSIGYPMDTNTYGGGFLYHFSMEDDPHLVALGLIVGLDYSDPYLELYNEFQRYKAHPHIRKVLEGGTVLSYGARTINEGGFQSIPKLVFPGGALIGCSAGFLNVPKIKGTHTAMKSGMVAADSAYEALVTTSPETTGTLLESYPDALKKSWLWEELKEVRNIRPAYKYGLLPFLGYSALEAYVFKGRVPWTVSHHKPDHQTLKEAKDSKPREYPKPDGVVTFDILTSLWRSGTNHNHDQPAHLRLKDAEVPSVVNWPQYAGPEGRFCPAKVYEYVGGEDGSIPKLQINAQNCLHCKACDIKDPTQNINWTVPEGGGGPAYVNM